MHLFSQKEGRGKEERKEKNGKESERNLSRTIEELMHFPRKKEKEKERKKNKVHKE